MQFKTKQEKLWHSDFGDEYIKRNDSEKLLYSKIGLFNQVLKCTSGINSIRELGCNIGLNLMALKKINPELNLYGVEINQKAAEIAKSFDIAEISNDSALNENNKPLVDLTMTVGFLIHVNPDELNKVYNNLYEGTNKYILIVEYFNPTPVTIEYRGQIDALFKRDFAGELIDKYSLNLVDYGFLYHKDNWIPQDDLNWFLLEKP